MEIGLDLESVDRFDLSRESSFVKDTYSQYEIKYAFSKDNAKYSLCGFFCAKEALIKALGHRPSKLCNIEVRHSAEGKPEMYLDFKLELNKIIKLFFSHCAEYATAVVIIYQQNTSKVE